jgi:hypothetical protein
LNFAAGTAHGLPAIVAAAIASSILTFLALAVTGWIGAPAASSASWTSPMDILVILSVVLIWGPAFALVPAGMIGIILERPFARRLIARGHGGFVAHLLIVTAASLCIWLLLRILVVMSGPQTEIFDPLSLAVFLIIGICSALSWWFLVIVPGRRVNAPGG